jgi:hypothetical protein
MGSNGRRHILRTGLDWVALSEPTAPQRWSQTSTRPSRCQTASPTRSPTGAGSLTECWESSATRPAIPSSTRRPAGIVKSALRLGGRCYGAVIREAQAPTRAVWPRRSSVVRASGGCGACPRRERIGHGSYCRRQLSKRELDVPARGARGIEVGLDPNTEPRPVVNASMFAPPAIMPVAETGSYPGVSMNVRPGPRTCSAYWITSRSGLVPPLSKAPSDVSHMVVMPSSRLPSDGLLSSVTPFSR